MIFDEILSNKVSLICSYSSGWELLIVSFCIDRRVSPRRLYNYTVIFISIYWSY